MPEVPHISWKRLSVEELKKIYETESKTRNQDEINTIVALVHLVETGKVRAFQRPDGEIYYQFDPHWETMP